jgi:hypothetical protein
MTPIIKFIIPIVIGLWFGAMLALLVLRILRKKQEELHAEYMKEVDRCIKAWENCKCQDKTSRFFEDVH